MQSLEEASWALDAAEATVESAEIQVETDPLRARAMLFPPGDDPAGFGPMWLADSLEAVSAGWGADPVAVQSRLAEAASLAARALLLIHEDEFALAFFRKSLDLAPRSDLELRTRLRLEVARLACPRLLSPADTLALVGDETTLEPSVNEDRVASMRLQLQLAEHIPDVRVPRVFQRIPSPLRDDAPNAHRLVPPFLVIQAQGLAAAGFVDEALQRLRSLAASDSAGLEMVRHAERALVSIWQRYRLNDEGEKLDTTLVSSPRFEDRALLMTLAALDGPKNDVTFDIRPAISITEWLHNAWRVRYALDDSAAAETVKFGAEYLPVRDPAPADDFLTVSVTLDRFELELLADFRHIPMDGPRQSLGFVDWLAWESTHPNEPADALRLLLRQQALINIARLPFGGRNDLEKRVGLRRTAEIAFEEADTLALRLPLLARPLYLFAAQKFMACNDVVGATMALSLARLGVSNDADEMLVENAALMVEYEGWWSLVFPGVRSMPHPVEISAIAEAPSIEGLLSVPRSHHRPWVMRVIACQLSPSKRDALREWLERNYAIYVDGEPRLSAEWTAFARRAPTSAPMETPRPTPEPVRIARGDAINVVGEPVVGQQASEQAEPQRRTLSRAVSVRLAAILLLASAIAIVATNGIRAGVLWLAACAVLGTAGWLAYQRIALWWARLRRLNVRIDSESGLPVGTGVLRSWGAQTDSVEALPREVGIRFGTRLTAPQLKAGWPPYQFASIDLGYHVTRIAEGQDYANLASASPPVSRLLRVLTQGLGGQRPLAVEIQPGQGLHDLCWEALFHTTDGHPDFTHFEKHPVRVWRRVTSGARPAMPRVQQLRGISVATTEVARTTVRAAATGHPPSGYLEWSINTQVLASPEVDVLHIVGSVSRSPSGVVLETHLPQSYATQTQVVTPSVVSREESAHQDEFVRRRPAELHQLYPNLSVLILQGYPQPLSARTSTEHYDAALARTFAAEMAASGVATIVIPRLEPAIAADVLRRVQTLIPELVEDGAKAVSDKLASVQQLIAQQVVGQQLTQYGTSNLKYGWELALDVCMYAPALPHTVI